MTENLTQKLKKKKGFTLIELIIVVAIIAILAALAIPKLMGTQDNAKRKADIANAKVIHDAVVTLITQDKMQTTDIGADAANATTVSTSATTISGYLQTIPVSQVKSKQNFKVYYNSTDKVVHVNIGDDEVYPTPASAWQQN